MNIREDLVKLGKFFKWTLIVVVSFYCLLLAINAIDEDPSSELTTLMSSPHVIDDPMNGYYGYVGLGAPLNQDIFNFGKQWADDYNAAKNTAVNTTMAEKYGKLDRLQFQGDTKLLCHPLKTACISYAKGNSKFIRQLATDNRELLLRIHKVIKAANFEEAYFASGYSSPISPWSEGSWGPLMLNLIALDAAEGRIAPAIIELEGLIEFHRKVLLGSHTVITAMLATVSLSKDYALLSEIVAMRPATLGPLKSHLMNMTAPIELAAVKKVAIAAIGGDMRKHHRDFFGGSWTASDEDSLLVRPLLPLLKHLASMNIMARYDTALLARIQDFTPDSADDWAIKTQGKIHELSSFPSWGMLYNPIGKVVLAEDRTDGRTDLFAPYLLKLSDLMGVTRLARLQVEIVFSSEKPNNDSINLITANKELCNPNTGKPMGYDQKARQIYYDLKGKQPDGVPSRRRVGI